MYRKLKSFTGNCSFGSLICSQSSKIILYIGGGCENMMDLKSNFPYLLCYWEALLKTICDYMIVEKAKMLSGNLGEKEILNVYQVFWCFFTVFFLQTVCLIIRKELTLISKPDQFNLFLTYMPKRVD
jgi:hypothetical protein